MIGSQLQQGFAVNTTVVNTKELAGLAASSNRVLR